MATKKAPLKTKKTVTVADPNTDSDGFLCLRGEILWKFRAVDAEHRNLLLGVEQKRAAVAEEITKHPDLLRLIGERDALILQANQHSKEVMSIQQEIEASLGIELKDCTIDDKTGRLFILTNGEQVPVLPKKPTKTVKTRGQKTAAHK